MTTEGVSSFLGLLWIRLVSHLVGSGDLESGSGQCKCCGSGFLTADLGGVEYLSILEVWDLGFAGIMVRVISGERRGAFVDLCSTSSGLLVDEWTVVHRLGR